MQRTVFTVFVILAICGAVGADHGRTEIGPTDTFPIVIDTPGSYVLTADLHVTTTGTNAIEITAENVDIDLGGHVIRGPGVSSTTGIGIYGINVIGVTIHNGSITEIAEGIKLTPITGDNGGSRLFDLTISHCASRGLKFSNGTARDIVVVDVGRDPAYGTPGIECSRCAISNVTVQSCSIGFIVYSGTLENCSSGSNLNGGFFLNWATLTRGLAISNGGDGIRAGEGTVVVASSVVNNGDVGISLTSNGNNNVINCTGYGNAGGNITGCGDGNGCHQNYLP